MIVRRSGWIAFLFLSLAIIPTVSSFYRGFPALRPYLDDKIPFYLDGMTGTPTDRKAANVKKVFGATDWMERTYHDDHNTRFGLFIARGFDCRPFFHLPENGILNRNWSARKYTVGSWHYQNKGSRIHTLDLTSSNTGQRAHYMLLYEGRTIGNPYWFLIRNMPRMLIKGRRPYTLIFVSYFFQEQNDQIDTRARRLLLAVLDHLQPAGQ